MATLRLATRGSPLALRQTELVSQLLQRAHPGLAVEPVVVRTQGRPGRVLPSRPDRGPGRVRHRGGGGGRRRAGRRGRALGQGHGLVDAGGVRARGGAAQAPTPATASSAAPWPACRRGLWSPPASARRRAQLAALRPDLVFTDLRGNMARRIAVAGEGRASAVVVAVAALERLGWESRLSDILDPVDVLPQAGPAPSPCSAGPTARRRRRLLAAIDHTPSQRALRAERAVLAGLGGSCTVPMRALPCRTVDGRGRLRLSAMLASGDGLTVRPSWPSVSGATPRPSAADRRPPAVACGGRPSRGWEPAPPPVALAVTVYLVGAGPGDPGSSPAGAPTAGPGRGGRLRPPGRPAVLSLAPPGALLVEAGRPSPGAGRRRDRARGDRRPAGRTAGPAAPWSASRGGPLPLRPRRRGGRGPDAGRRGLGSGARGHLGHRRAGLRRDPGHPPRAVDLGHRGDRPGGEPPAAGSGLGGAGPDRRHPGHPHGHDHPFRHRPPALVAGGRPADTPVAVVEWGTIGGRHPTTLAGLADVALSGPRRWWW